MSILLDHLQQTFPELVFQSQHLLAPYTTVKIGGLAEIFCEVKDHEQFIDLVSLCKKESIPLTIIGWGANTLIADRGIAGLVIKYSAQSMTILEKKKMAVHIPLVSARWEHAEAHEDEYPQFNQLNYSEKDQPSIQVEIEAGVPLPFAINSLLQQGVTGLQWFSRIPATIGGAIFNNIHGGTHFISEYIQSVTVIDANGEIQILSANQLEFGYDYSRFHHSEEVIISALFSLYRGDVDKAKQVVGAWAQQKKNQPQNTLGCVFQNISTADQTRLQYPTPSVGYIVDKILHKKGFRIGDAQISDKHAAFIENKGHATAQDYLAVIKIVITEIKEKTGLTIKPEIFFKGFTKEELAFLE